MPHEFKLETTFSDKSNLRWFALGGAAVLLIGILLTMTTSIPEQLLPMNDSSLREMVPRMRDGSAPLALKAFDRDVEGRKTLHISGKIENRSDNEIQRLVAVIQPQDVHGHPLQTLEIPVEPAALPAFEVGSFAIVTELTDRPGILGIRFKLANGPFIPHKDERPIGTSKEQ